MSIASTILAAFAADEVLTNEKIRDRTGLAPMQVIAILARLRQTGDVKRVGTCRRPVSHRLAGAAKTRADLRARVAALGPAFSEGGLVGQAWMAGRTSVFDLGRSA